MALQSMGFDKQLLVHIYHAFLSFCFAFFYILILGNIVESPPSWGHHYRRHRFSPLAPSREFIHRKGIHSPFTAAQVTTVREIKVLEISIRPRKKSVARDMPRKSFPLWLQCFVSSRSARRYVDVHTSAQKALFFPRRPFHSAAAEAAAVARRIWVTPLPLGIASTHADKSVEVQWG